MSSRLASSADASGRSSRGRLKLTVPAHLAQRGATLNIVARLLARSERPQTGPILIHPGDTYEVRLTSDLLFLSFFPAGS